MFEVCDENGRVVDGRVHYYNCPYEVRVDIKTLEKLIEKVREPQILCYTGMDCIDFSGTAV